MLFHNFLNNKDNDRLMEDATKEELQKFVHSFMKDKSIILDGWPIDFFGAS